jgi:peroxiredoxin
VTGIAKNPACCATVDSLAGRKLPDLSLPASSGNTINPAAVQGLAIYIIYPWTGKPGHPNPPGWDDISGAHGSTPQLRAYSMVYHEFEVQHVKLFGLSLQTPDWQRDFVTRNALAFPLLSDAGEGFSRALSLSTFEAGGSSYLKRHTLLVRDGVVLKHWPVAGPEQDATQALRVIRELQP